MKQRVITGLIFGIVFIGALLLMNTFVFPIFIVALSCVAVYEIEKAVGLNNKLISAATLVVSALIPLFTNFNIKVPVGAFGCIYVVLILIFMLEKILLPFLQ